MDGAKKIDYLIVGQGLAGSALAIHLLLRKKKILVVNRADGATSSEVAAGIFNPVTGKMLAKTWLADEIFPFLDSFYRLAEKLTGATFYHSMPIYRPFVDAADQNEWMGRSENAAMAGYVKGVFTAPQYPETLHDPFGGLLIDKCGYVDTRAYVAAVRNWLERQDCYVGENLYPENFRTGLRGVKYGRFTAEVAVFCEGNRVYENPWFDWVPVKPLKGELLTVHGKFLKNVIVNRGVYMVPGNGSWQVGSTYEREFDRPGVTPEGRYSLEERLRGLTKNQFTVEVHTAGIRPSTPDRRPLLGRHPEYPNMVIFNGLGTKGVSLTPYFSAELVEWLEKEKQLSKAVDISRYKSLYWNSR